MAAVDSSSYDQFYDAFEEFNFPKIESNTNLAMGQSSPKPNSWLRDAQDFGIVGEFFRAMEQASLPLMPSSESLVSLSSRPSMGSNSAFTSDDQLNESFFNVVQNLIVTNSNSQTHLSQLEETHGSIMLPSVMMKFLDVYNAFMHNPNEEEI